MKTRMGTISYGALLSGLLLASGAFAQATGTGSGISGAGTPSMGSPGTGTTSTKIDGTSTSMMPGGPQALPGTPPGPEKGTTGSMPSTEDMYRDNMMDKEGMMDREDMSGESTKSPAGKSVKSPSQTRHTKTRPPSGKSEMMEDEDRAYDPNRDKSMNPNINPSGTEMEGDDPNR